MSNGNKQCRFCKESLSRSFADLGMSPLANSYVKPSDIHAMEPFFPLHAYVCESCLLVQLEEFDSAGASDIFSNYSYFSSYSDSWLQHAKKYTDRMIDRFGIDSTWRVVEIASNDGYLLQYFKNMEIPVLGIEPAENVARAALDKGIPTLVKFFSASTAHDLVSEGQKADLLIGNNVLAHVPDLNDFIAGQKYLLNQRGVITMEFPHLLCLVEENQFDTIYHEHFSYYSLLTVEKIYSAHGLTVFDVEELPTHGGSLRIFVRHNNDDSKPVEQRVARLKAKETAAGLSEMFIYDNYAEKVKNTKRKLLNLLIGIKQQGKRIVGYGAAAKGNTLLNYCGIRSDFLDYVVDVSPHKQGQFLPGSRIEIYAPDRIKETLPDYVLILPWNLQSEIMGQIQYIREWGGKFIIPIPEARILD